jgi:hypothetical protein
MILVRNIDFSGAEEFRCGLYSYEFISLDASELMISTSERPKLPTKKQCVLTTGLFSTML